MSSPTPAASTSPSVGLATKTGLATVLTGFAGAVVNYLVSGQSNSNLGTVVAAGVGVLALLAVLVGRYAQSLMPVRTVLSDAKPFVADAEKAGLFANGEAAIRKIVGEEIAKLKPGTVATVAQDVVADLPTAAEEAAAQPPATVVPPGPATVATAAPVAASPVAPAPPAAAV